MSFRQTTVPQKSPSVTVAGHMLCSLITVVHSGELSVNQHCSVLGLITKLPVCPCLNGHMAMESSLWIRHNSTSSPSPVCW